jgi:superfamily II DNA or RNA helicase
MKVFLLLNKSCVLKDFESIYKSNPTIIGLLKDRFTYKNPDFVRNEKYGYSNYSVPEYLLTYHVLGSDLHLPRGCYREIVASLRNFGFEVVVVNKMNEGRGLTLDVVSPVILREDQQNALNDIVKYKRGLVRAPTSFGKTVTVLELLFQYKKQMTIVVHTTFLQKQWINEAVKLFKLKPSSIGGCGGIFSSKPRVSDLNICLYHTLNKPDMLALFTKDTGVVVADEVQRAAIDMFTFCLRNFDSSIRIGVSANEKRKDGKEFIVTDHMGAVIHEAVEKASDSKILSYITIINTNYFDYEYDWDKNHSALVTRISKDKERNTLILNRCLQKVNQGKQVLIMVERKEQCFLLQGALLKKGLKVGVLAGAVSKEEINKFQSNMAKHYAFQYEEKTAYEFIKRNTENKNLQVVIGTQKIEAGISLRTLNHLIISTLASSNIEDRLNQIVGRIERTHGKELEKLFGVKETPTVDLLMDTKFKNIAKQKIKVKKFFEGRVTELGSIRK